MKNSDISSISQKNMQQSSFGIDPKIVLSLLLKYWYLYLAGIIIAFFGARLYIGHTMAVFQSSATILINDTDRRQTLDNEQLLQGLGLSGSMNNLENQIAIISSRALTEKALKELPFNIEYYIRTFRNALPLYPQVPVRILYEKEIPLPKDVEFSISYSGNNTFKLESENENYPFSKSASFGESIEIPEGSFRIELKDESWFTSNKSEKLYFVIYSPVRLTGYFNSRLQVEQLSRTGSIISISMTGTNPAKDVDFLNTLAEIFKANSLDKKNNEAIRRIQFIDDQLVGISDSLNLTENKLQQFRSAHRVMDLSAQGQAIIQQVTILDNERVRLNLEANYYEYLSDYLAKDVSGQLPVVPITMGISDPGLSNLVSELAELQGQLSSKGAGEINPLQKLLAQRVRVTKDALLETLNGLKRANSLAKNENQEQINRINSQASALPATERQLLGIERKFRLNDEMYTFLLETRAEQMMQKASNMSDSEVIDPADVHYSHVISPNRNAVYLIALLLGAGFPFTLLFLRFVLNKKVTEEDITGFTNLPVVGNIPHSTEKSNTVVLEFPGSSIAEAYRLMRSRMQFFTKDSESPVILITSSVPGEGKTYTSINLASVYSLLGKKTVLVGFDLRKPKIFSDFNLHNDKGVSTFLIGKDKLQEIIQPTSYNNLSVIAAGPIPPNPSELTALDKTSELLKMLREKFEIIIIDSSPIGIVSDSLHLASLADTCIMVIRPGVTLKDALEANLRELKTNDLKALGLVINDTRSSNNYGYGGKYGYTNEKQKAG